MPMINAPPSLLRKPLRNCRPPPVSATSLRKMSSQVATMCSWLMPSHVPHALVRAPGRHLVVHDLRDHLQLPAAQRFHLDDLRLALACDFARKSSPLTSFPRPSRGATVRIVHVFIRFHGAHCPRMTPDALEMREAFGEQSFQGPVELPIPYTPQNEPPKSLRIIGNRTVSPFLRPRNATP